MNDNNKLLAKTDWSYEWPDVDICGPLPFPGHPFLEKREFAFDKATRRCGTLAKRWKYGYNREEALKLSVWAYPLDLIDVSPESAIALLFGSETISHRRGRWEQPRQRLPSRELVTILSYPFQKTAIIRIYPYSRKSQGTMWCPIMDVGWLLWCVARAYKHIYEHADEYGIWGHHLGDLLFRELKIDGNNFYLGIDS